VTRVFNLRAMSVFVSAGICFAQQYTISTVAGGAPPATGIFAGNSSIGAPQNIALDSAGNVYFTSGNCVFEELLSGELLPIAGNSKAGFSGDGGPAANAQLWSPIGVAVDSSENVFIADSGNNRIRKVSSTGLITTVAGVGTAGFSGDGGAAVSAQLSGVQGAAVDASGDLFIADTGNNRIRKVTPDGLIATVAGNGVASFGGDGGPALSGQFSATSLAIDTAGDIFIGDSANYRVREVMVGGTIRTIAGSGFEGNSGNGGGAGGAEFSSFHQIAVDALGNVYIADTGNSSIQEVLSGAGSVQRVAGNGANGFFGDNSSATTAALAFPRGIAVDSSGELFIADTSNYRVRYVNTNGVISTIAGTGSLSYSGDGGAAPSAQISSPEGLAVDRLGNIFEADAGNNVVREIQGGVISTVAGTGVAGFSGEGGAGTSAQLSAPQGVAADNLGNVYIADTGNYRVRDLVTGTITTVAGFGYEGYAGDGGQAVTASLSAGSVAVDSSGNIYVGDPYNFRVREISAATGTITTAAGNGTQGFSGDNGSATGAQLSGVAGIAVDSSGNLFIADAGNNRIRKVSSGTITTVAGNGTVAELNHPLGVAVDSSGNVFIADTGNNRVREVSSGGTIKTIAGNGVAGYVGDGGGATNAELAAPAGIAVAKAGIYVSDAGNNAIRLLTSVSQSVIISAVFDAASESAVALTPGKIAVIYGSGLGPATGVIASPVNGVFGQSLAGTTVSFRGVTAPVYYASATQVNAIVPYEVTGSSSISVEVSYQNQVSLPFNVSFAASQPGIFTANATGAGQAAAINVKDGTLNSASNPAKIGDYISLYATGEGLTSPAGFDGKLDGSPQPKPNLLVTATVGGVAATVQYAGGVYGVVAGLMQVNIQIPAGITAGGYVPVVLTVGNTSTAAGAVWIAVASN
jgi:uncharacterized protein (TIGR03437 family)